MLFGDVLVVHGLFDDVCVMWFVFDWSFCRVVFGGMCSVVVHEDVYVVGGQGFGRQ